MSKNIAPSLYGMRKINTFNTFVGISTLNMCLECINKNDCYGNRTHKGIPIIPGVISIDRETIYSCSEYNYIKEMSDKIAKVTNNKYYK